MDVRERSHGPVNILIIDFAWWERDHFRWVMRGRIMEASWTRTTFCLKIIFCHPTTVLHHQATCGVVNYSMSGSLMKTIESWSTPLNESTDTCSISSSAARIPWLSSFVSLFSTLNIPLSFLFLTKINSQHYKNRITLNKRSEDDFF